MMDRSSSALQFISPVDRDTWVAMGMALSSEYGDAARDVWMEWSRQADSFKDADARAVWRSFKGRGVSISSLFHEAKQSGWKDEGYQRPTPEQYAEQVRVNAKRYTDEGKARAAAAIKATAKAKWILDQCKQEEHAYLHSKGFPKLQGLVWRPEQESNLLCIPMYVGKSLAGLQMVDRDGNKKFLSGQITSKAEFVMDSGALGASDFFCEGYASGLSLRACLEAIKASYRIHVTFSANNLQRMAHSGFVVADNDASGTGLKAAQATGLQFWMPSATGTDINDFHKANGTFRASQTIAEWLRRVKAEQEYYAN